jgi:hypothetical protein
MGGVHPVRQSLQSIELEYYGTKPHQDTYCELGVLLCVLFCCFARLVRREFMHSGRGVVWVLGLSMFAVPIGLVAKPAPADKDAIVIVFKDGRQQTFSLADIERIEFKSPLSRAVVTGLNSFLGKWKVGNGAGGTFFITLERDGVASKSIGSSHGTWTVVDKEARISWDDGWHDAIRKVGTKFEKFAYEPGKSFTDQPSNVTDAKNTEAQPL